jgi:hypothetical protein
MIPEQRALFLEPNKTGISAALTDEQEASLERRTSLMTYFAGQEYRAMFIALTRTQARCTELIQETRALRAALARARSPLSR